MNKKLIVILSCIIILLAGCFTTFLLINNKTKDVSSSEVYGIVKQVNNDSIVVEDKDNSNNTKTYMIDTKDIKEGDLIYIRLNDSKVEDIKVLVDNYASLTTTPIIVIDDITTTQSITTPTTTTTNRTYNNTTNVITTQTKDNRSKDEIILSYMEDEKKNVDNTTGNNLTIKERLKSGFCTIVDFIFYNGTIKGITFNELQATTKAKVIYYALLIDSGIDSKFPNYKDNIADKYKDIKGRLVIEFLELKYDICEASPDGCKQAQEDFNLLKYSLNLSWDMIKSFFSYVKDLTVPKIQAWYETFRG